MSWGGTERERIPRRVLAVNTEPNAGLNLMNLNCEIMT